jgi:hypothetical protein
LNYVQLQALLGVSVHVSSMVIIITATGAAGAAAAAKHTVAAVSWQRGFALNHPS